MIDTLRASKTLQKNGFSLQQSDILAKVIAQQSEELATKQDIQLLKKDTETLQLAMRQDIQLFKKDTETLQLATRQDIQILKKDTETLQLAMKQDIQILKKDMKQDIQLLRKDTETLREDITKSIRHIFWLLALIFPVIITILVLFAQR